MIRAVEEILQRQLSVALVGCGGIGRDHIENVTNTAAMRLVATVDLDEAAARKLGEEGGADYWTSDFDRALADESIEAILVGTTHHTHTDLTLQALSAGKHVFVEKPPSMTIAEAKRVQQASHETGLQVMSGWWFKHSPITKRLREVIRRPRTILFTCRIGQIDPRTGAPHSSDPYARNGILDVAGYNLHWIWHVMRSQPVEVMAMGLDRAASNTSSILIQFENGGMADSITGHMGMGGILSKHYWEVGAEEMSASSFRFTNLVFDGTDEPGIAENVYRTGFHGQLAMFAELVLEGGRNRMDAWEANVPTVIFEKALESMRSRRAVPVEMEKEFYLPEGRLPDSIAQFGDVG